MCGETYIHAKQRSSSGCGAAPLFLLAVQSCEALGGLKACSSLAHHCKRAIAGHRTPTSAAIGLGCNSVALSRLHSFPPQAFLTVGFGWEGSLPLLLAGFLKACALSLGSADDDFAADPGTGTGNLKTLL